MTREKILDLLVEEYKRTTKDIITLITDSEKIFGIWVTVITFAFAIGLKEGIREIFLLLPGVIIAVFFYLINIYERIVTSSGYAAVLEDKVNEMLEKKVLIWESHLTHDLHHFRLSTVLLIIVCLCISTGIIAYSIYRQFTDYPTAVGGIQAVVVSALLLTGVLLVVQLDRLRRKARQMAERECCVPTPTPSSERESAKNEPSAS